MLKVGFYLRELNFRGIANSIFIYAKNNQTILKNKSIIFYNSTALDNKPEAIKEFKKKFKTIKISNFNELEEINKKLKPTSPIVFIIKLIFFFFRGRSK